MIPAQLPALAQEIHSDELVSGLADKAADHAAVAAFFRRKGQQAREIAEMHRRMAQTAAGGSLTEREAMQEHCKLLATRGDEVAALYEKLADAHEKEAKATPN